MAERDPPDAESVQGGLFDRAPVVLRRVASSGATLRLRLEPLGDGRVRVLEAARRPRGAARFARLPHEEGRVVRYEQLRLDIDYTSLFGSED